MTQNLRLVGPRTLTSKDSDVIKDFALTADNSSAWCMTETAACVNQTLVLYSGDTDYGTYYNYFTATAGTGGTSLASGEASSSICPLGWRLPNGTESFVTLYNYYSPASAFIDAPISPGFAGWHYSSTVYQGYVVYYWTSTVTGQYTAHTPDINTSRVLPASYGAKWYGFSVRCVAN